MVRKCNCTGGVGSLGIKRNRAKCSCPTGAEEKREMEVYQERSITGKLNDQGQVSSRHLLPSHRTGVLHKGCTGRGYWNGGMGPQDCLKTSA